METPGNTRLLLASCLEQGRHQIGQILLGADFTLRHIDDDGRPDLLRFDSPSDAREIARFDAEGRYRPLKTAPNLKGGWLLAVGSLEGMELALEVFYPAALGFWLSALKGELRPTSLRETLGRQTGMYRVTQLLSDDQALELIARCCNAETGCLRTILWDLAPGVPVSSLPPAKRTLEGLPSDRIPLLCRELCNLVVAAARPIAKGNLPKKD